MLWLGPVPGWAAPETNRAQLLAQIGPTTVTGQLDETSPLLEDGSYFNIHSFEGAAGEPIRIDLVSEDFDAYLFLVGPAGIVAQDDNGGDGTNASLAVILPTDGTYQIAVNAGAGETGTYQLTWRVPTADALAQAQALQRANQLDQQRLALYEAGRYGEAIAIAQEVLVIRREQLGEQHYDVAQSLNSLALLYRAQGRYGEAEPLYQQVLAIVREQLGERHSDVAVSLNNLALLYAAQGRYGEAESFYQQALGIYREQLGERHPLIARSLSNLALLYETMGRYAEAEPLYQSALDIYQEQLGNDHPNVAETLNNLALLYDAQGRYEAAEPLYQQALIIYRQQLGDNHPSVASGLNNLASLYTVQGRYAAAEPLYQEALAIYRQQLGDRHPSTANSLNNLAELYRAMGRNEAAEPLYQQVLDISREQLGEHHPLVATYFNNLAVLSVAQGRLTEAIGYLTQGLDIEEWNLALNLATLTDTQRQDYVATVSGSTSFPLSLHLQSPAPPAAAAELALTTLLRRKGRLLDAGINSLQVLRQNLTPADQATLDDLTALYQQLATLTFNRPADLTPAQYQAERLRLETQARALETDLARRSAAFRAEIQPVELAAVQAQIPTDAVLVEYSRYRPYDATNAQNPWGAERYAVYLLFPDGRIEATDLGEATEIDGAVNRLTEQLRDRNASPANARALTALVLDPIRASLGDRDHLLISPDSQLNRIPFEALQDRDGHYLIEQYQISYLNSGRDLLKLNINSPSTAPAVVLANPDYEQAAGSPRSVAAGAPVADASGQRSTQLRQLRVGPLPGTASEAEAILPLLPSAMALTGAQATENALKQVQAPRILHIATHGFFLENVVRPNLENGRGLGVVASDEPISQPAVTAENPLLRSGLALAGFNGRASGDEDGVLTALEAAQLNLLGTQLVVLSACKTGLGDIANGEGVYGLRRAFAIAGAETQLISLWQVDDFGTQSLMVRYYENLTAGMGRSEALRQVQLEMIAAGGEYSHPFYWSAFVLTGDWRSLE